MTRVDVGEHRPRALVQRGVGRGDERERARDDLIALLHADRAQRQVQPGGAAADARSRVRRPRARRTAARTRPRAARARAARSAAPRSPLAPPPRPAPAGPAGSSRSHASPALDAGRARALGPAAGRRPRCMPYSSESTSASQEAAIRFSETPIEPHTSCPSEASISTRVTAPVPLRLVEDAHLEVDELDVAQVRVDLADRLAQRAVERVARARCPRRCARSARRRAQILIVASVWRPSRRRASRRSRARTPGGTAARTRRPPCASAARTSRRRPRTGSPRARAP